MISGSNWSIKEVNHEKVANPARAPLLLRQLNLCGGESPHVKSF
jgi:hypothetical protein